MANVVKAFVRNAYLGARRGERRYNATRAFSFWEVQPARLPLQEVRGSSYLIHSDPAAGRFILSNSSHCPENETSTTNHS
jgi:hypothetical protein